MKTSVLMLIAMLVVVTGSQSAAQQSRAEIEKRFAAAQHKATAEGDLKGAIEDYKKIVASAGGNRKLAAQVLIAMAEAYQQLGNIESMKIYQQIVRDFTDQAEALLVARTRLGGSASPAIATKGDRAVWTGADVDLFGTVSPDGRYLTYVDWRGAANVMVRDLVANTNRPLTGNTLTNKPFVADFSAISRDGSQVAYWWGGGEFRVSSLTGTGIPAYRVVRTGAYIRPFDWSPDNTAVAALVDERQLGVVNMRDGTLRQLKSIGWQSVGKMVFSPDGRYIAYDMASAERRGQRDILVIAADGSSEAPVVADAFRNYVMGWSPAGDLVFSSDRSGTRSLWTVRVTNGRAQGKPRLGKENVRSTWSLGLTPSGTLYVWQPASPSYVGVAAFDSLSGGVLDSGPDGFQRYIESRGHPRWSADGRHMAFISCGLSGGGPCSLFIRDGSAEPREVLHGMWYMGPPLLSPDGSAVIAQGSDLNDQGGIFLIDTRTGKTSKLLERNGPTAPRNPLWSSDGRTIRYMENRDQDVVLMERAIDSEQAKEIFRTGGAIRPSSIDASPDGRQVALVRRAAGDFQTVPGTLDVASLSGGVARTILTSPGLVFQQWAADGQSVIVHKHLPSGVEVWRVPLAGPALRLPIGSSFSHADDFDLSPDGQRIAFVAQAGAVGDQVMALENFLP